MHDYAPGCMAGAFAPDNVRKRQKGATCCDRWPLWTSAARQAVVIPVQGIMPSGEPPAADNPGWMSPPTDERRSGGSARQTVEQARPGAKKAGFRTSPGWRSKPRLFHPWSRVAWTVWPALSGWLFASRRKGIRPAGRAASSRMNKVCLSVSYRPLLSPHPVAAYPEARACGEGMRR